MITAEGQADGWIRIRLRPVSSSSGEPGSGDNIPRSVYLPGQVAVLTSAPPPVVGAITWASRAPQVQMLDEEQGAGKRALSEKTLNSSQASEHRMGPPALKEGRRTPEDPGSVSQPGSPSRPSSLADSCSAGEPADRHAPSPSERAASMRGEVTTDVASSGVHIVTGSVASGGRGGKEIEVLIRGGCPHHTRVGDSSSSTSAQAPCIAAALTLQRAATKQRTWWLVCIRGLVSERREFDAVHRASQLSPEILPYLLRPTLLRGPAAIYNDPVSLQGYSCCQLT